MPEAFEHLRTQEPKPRYKPGLEYLERELDKLEEASRDDCEDEYLPATLCSKGTLEVAEMAL